ncbi:DUF4870 domain-containing protein [Candidatus Micrarchaeota archaeon]|nr:DUF4870 domain-containing protein [Candidatus Micrarchaeota archaeon]
MADEKKKTQESKPQEVKMQDKSQDMKSQTPKSDSKVPSTDDDSKLFGALCYVIGIIVPLFILFTDKKENKFLAFHAYQSLIFGVAVFAMFIALSIFSFVITILTSGIGGFLGLCIMLPLWLGALLAMVFMAYKAWMGEKYLLPVIGSMAEGFVK